MQEMVEGIPKFLYNLLISQYGKNITKEILNGYSKKKYVTLRVNTLKSNVNNIEQKLKENQIEYNKISWYKDALILKNITEQQLSKTDMYINGEIYLQNLSSMIPPIILDPKMGENILDMAAAPRRQNNANGCNIR